GQLKKRGTESCFAFIVGNVDLTEVHRPATRVRTHVDLRPRQKDRANGTTIFPVHLEWILVRITPQTSSDRSCTCAPAGPKRSETLNVLLAPGLMSRQVITNG